MDVLPFAIEPVEGAQPARAEPASALDRAVAELGDRARAFARMPPAEKASLLRSLLPRIAAVAGEQVALSCRAKDIDPTSRRSGEEWLAGPVPVLMNTRLLAESLDQIAARGRPDLPKPWLRDEDDRAEVTLAPRGLDRGLYAGIDVKVIFEEGLHPKEVAGAQARFYQEREPEGSVSLILGAGNVASIAPMDALSKLFVEGKVSLVKTSPVNAYLRPSLEQAFAPLVERGFLRFVDGGAEEGSYLANHPGISDVHLTGSAATHDRLVWGATAEEREQRKAEGDPLLKKPVTSELGNVSPILVLPYLYSADELWFQARNVASQVVNNASFNCNAGKMLVLPKCWPQEKLFLELVEKALSTARPRKAYYPGAIERWEQLTAGRSSMKTLGGDGPSDGALPWTLIRDLDPRSTTEPLFSTEPFCSLLSVVSVGEDDLGAYLEAATAFCNDKLWGTLSCALISHPSREDDPGAKAAIDKALMKLRYGAIAVNQWPAVLYAMAAPPWGGHPSAGLSDVQSGIGFVHNTLMLGRAEKAILRAPVRARPKPAYFLDHGRMNEVGERLCRFAAAPSLRGLASVAAAAITG
jgi:acyl-CoA reductase-like NAD-dependent aldehyde dehydrogenase